MGYTLDKAATGNFSHLNSTRVELLSPVLIQGIYLSYHKIGYLVSPSKL